MPRNEGMNQPNERNMLTPDIKQESQEVEKKMGVIYSPRPGGSRRWKKIRRCLDEMGFSYDYVRSESSADVERFAAIMTKNSYTEILVVAGDAALNYAVNGIMKAALPDGKCPALGIIPAGYSNDFAHYWGLYSKDYRKNIQALLENRKRSIDVGRCAIETKNGEQTEYFLNCVNVGAAASIMNLKHLTFSVFGLRTVSHFLSAFMLLFSKLTYNLQFTTAGEVVNKRAMTLCIGSARGYGQTPSAVPYNGLLDISLVTTPKFTQLIHGIYLLLTGRFLSHKGISVWRTRKVDFTQLSEAPVSLDGRYVCNHVKHLKVDVLKEAIDFLII